MILRIEEPKGHLLNKNNFVLLLVNF